MKSRTPEPIGFIGLGDIGSPMARRLLDGPAPLIVFDLDTSTTADFADAGARVASSTADLARDALVICVMVRDDRQVEMVIREALTTARPGSVLAIHSTVESATPGRMADLAEPHGVHVVDAPVSGGAMGAHDGNLAFLVGGSDEAVTIVRDAFAPMAGIVAHLGPVGAGTRAKLARNLITFASFTAAAEAVRLAHAAGVDLAQLGEVVRHSDRVTGGAGAIMLGQPPGPLPVDGGLRPYFDHSRVLGEKDLDLAIELGAELGVDLPIAEATRERLGTALGVPHHAEGFDDDEH